MEMKIGYTTLDSGKRKCFEFLSNRDNCVGGILGHSRMTSLSVAMMLVLIKVSKGVLIRVTVSL